MSPVKSGSDAAKRCRYRANYTRARSGIWQGKVCARMRGITGVPRIRAVFRRIGAVAAVRVTGDRGARRDGCGVGHTLFRRSADFCFPGLAGSGSACPISVLGSYDVQRRVISWRRRSVLSENPAEGPRRNLLEVELEVEPGLDTECSGLIGQEADTGPGPPLPIERQERDLVSQVVDEERDVPSASPNTCAQVEQVV